MLRKQSGQDVLVKKKNDWLCKQNLMFGDLICKQAYLNSVYKVPQLFVPRIHLDGTTNKNYT